jgi:hypothetical protein
MRSGFQPSLPDRLFTQGFALGWDEGAPLALGAVRSPARRLGLEGVLVYQGDHGVGSGEGAVVGVEG